MESTAIDNMVRMADRHRTLLGIAAAVWFWAGVAVYARFVELPGLPEIVKQGFFWLAAAGNAAWWGFLNPRIAARRKALGEQGTVSPPRE